MGTGDRGGTKELAEIVDETRFPLVMTANDAYDSKIKTLRNKAELIEIGSVHTNSIVAHLKQILENEGIEYEESAVKRIARQADGQMRSAINDLQAAAAGKDKLVDADTDVVGVRDSEQEVFEALKMIFKTSNAETARRATDNLSEDPDTFVQWVRENIPREYKKIGDRKRAFDWLSKADIFNGRIRRSMNWKLLKYVYHFSTIGVALSKDEKYDGWTRYQYPSKLKQMGKSRANRNKRDAVSQKIGEKLHISLSTSVQTMPFLAKIIEENEEVAEQLDLEEEDVEFLHKFVS
jgi:replication factor C large subunit